MLPAVLVARFVCELCLLVGAVVFGSWLGDDTWSSLFLAIAAGVVVGVIWGASLSPKARYSLSLPLRVVIELALFATVAVGLWRADHQLFGAALLAAEVLVLAALFALGESPGRRYDH
ncbi:MAG TPA: YrdB family protein [Actinomycetes bacterium]|nr:YrdB family protein [Actinomycetes bacterium]